MYKTRLQTPIVCIQILIRLDDLLIPDFCLNGIVSINTCAFSPNFVDLQMCL